jgi:Caspase domain
MLRVLLYELTDKLSIRTENGGSWYIQTLCEEIKAHRETLDLVKILTIVNEKMTKKEAFSVKDPRLKGAKQVASFISTLTKDLYL